MSNQHLNSLRNCNKFKGNTRLLLFVLADRASDGTSRNGKKNLPFGWTARSLEQLMQETNIHRKQTLTACMTELIDAGAISRVRRFDRPSKTFVDIDWLKANAYPQGAETEPNEGAESAPTDDEIYETDGAESAPNQQRKPHPSVGAESAPSVGAVCESLEPNEPNNLEPQPSVDEPQASPKVKGQRKEGGKEEMAPFATLTTPVSPDLKSENSCDHEGYQSFLDCTMKDLVTWEVMRMMQTYWDEEGWTREVVFAQAIVDEARGLGFNPMAQLLHNRSHHKPTGKHGGLYLRSFQQWHKAITAGRILNDYDTCLKNPCDICKEHAYGKWVKDHPMLGVDAIECGCKNTLSVNYRCNACLMENNGMRLVKSKDLLRVEWQEAEAQRKEKLARFDMRYATQEEYESFKSLLATDWPSGAIKPKTTRGPNDEPAEWGLEELHAAALLFLKHGQTVTWDEFEATVNTVKELMTPIPNPEEAKGTAA